MPSLTIGTRGSQLARWQTDYVANRLRAVWHDLTVDIRVIQTHGDRVLDTPLPLIGGKGVFTAELEAALHAGTIDLAVHSLKDLPTDDPDGLTIAALPERADPHDVLVSRSGCTLATLPEGAVIGTSSRRRAAQMLAFRPDLQTADIRGNVDTRVRKALDPTGAYDATLLAAAGLDRLGMDAVISERIALDVLLPAPGQAALAVQTRRDGEARRWLAPLDHAPTRAAVTAERAFLAGLGGGCALPIAAYATVEKGWLTLRGRVTAPNGRAQIDVQLEGDASDAAALGQTAASHALALGAADILAALAAGEGEGDR